MQRRKVPDRLWIIKVTYLTEGTTKLQRIRTTKGLIFNIYVFELVFNPATSSFPSNRQHLAESDKIIVNFVITQ